ncbi:MAG: hypothetical protein AB7V46_21545 [Thermomicrobiales bacterium]|uniref:hypothetical protein n=1 Tax=Pseudorhodoplanes sp. TaxID=1934341 RepID=UPI003D138402
MYRLALSAALVVTLPAFSHAQSEVQWTQTLSTPKGATIPRDRADIVGIEMGDTYAEAKAKLLKLFEEGIQPREAQEDVPPFTKYKVVPVKETRTSLRFKAPGSSQIVTASFVRRLKMERETKGTGPRAIDETIEVVLSSPASGHQVIGIERTLEFRNESDQPRVSEFLAQVNAKLKGQPRISLIGDQGTYTYQFNDGNVVAPSKSDNYCYTRHGDFQAAQLVSINKTGDCDAVLQIKIGFGISRDHAKYIQFVFSDNDRVKANLTADFAFVENYVRTLQDKTRGATPKL